MTRMHRGIVVGLVALHTVLLLGYTLPSQFVPERWNDLSLYYVRPLFHQQWQLFAPDPPLCSCAIEVILSSEDIRSIDHGKGYLSRRMAQAIARRVQVEVAHGDATPHPDLMRAMKNMVGD